MCYLFLKRSHSFPLSCVFRDSFAVDRTLTWGRLEPPRICDWTGRWEQTEAEPGAKTLGENERPTRFVLVFFFVSKPKRELCNMSLKHHRFSCRGKKVLFRCGEARAFFHSVFSLRMDLLSQNKSSLLSQQTTAGALLKAREHSTVQRCLILADWKL